MADPFPDGMLSIGASCAVTSWVTRATIWSIVDCVNNGPELWDTTVEPVPGRLKLTECWVPDATEVVTVEFGALTATAGRVDLMANRFERRVVGTAEGRLGGIWRKGC